MAYVEKVTPATLEQARYGSLQGRQGDPTGELESKARAASVAYTTSIPENQRGDAHLDGVFARDRARRNTSKLMPLRGGKTRRRRRKHRKTRHRR
jgi:hypothetical protein